LLGQDRADVIVDLVDRQIVAMRGIDQHRAVGGVGLAIGRRVGQRRRQPPAALIAVWTSWAAPSMSRERSNCRVMEVEPSPLVEVIWLRSGIAPNCCSSGVATEEAMVSGLAPGNW